MGGVTSRVPFRSAHGAENQVPDLRALSLLSQPQARFRGPFRKGKHIINPIRSFECLAE